MAGLIEHNHTTLAGFTVAAVWIPHRSLRADITFLAIEVWGLFWAVHTFLLGNAVDLIMRADLANLLSEVEVVRMVALDADSTVEE